MAKILPNDGGCWYCFTTDDDLVFCSEFDCNVHLECARTAVKKDPEDREASIIFAEIDGEKS